MRVELWSSWVCLLNLFRPLEGFGLSFSVANFFFFSDNEWILLNKEVKCDDNDDNSPATLGLSNMRGVFIMVVFGIVGGMFLICLEIMFKKHQRRMQKKDSMAKTAVRKWRGNVEVPTYRNFVKMSFSPLNALNLVSRNIFDYGKF